jgi:hypothetical protein
MSFYVFIYLSVYYTGDLADARRCVHSRGEFLVQSSRSRHENPALVPRRLSLVCHTIRDFVIALIVPPRLS